MTIKGVPLFLTFEEEEYFSNLTQYKKSAATVFVSDTLKYEILNNLDSKISLTQLSNNWFKKNTDPAWTPLFINLNNYLNDEELVIGDLRRRSIQILEALEKN
ncbi:MAG: hypothetical protein K1000chlam3_01455 [Chlamydiae bacterium]|nr:hypothetical protein [Chlamydiota bacterium]